MNVSSVTVFKGFIDSVLRWRTYIKQKSGLLKSKDRTFVCKRQVLTFQNTGTFLSDVYFFLADNYFWIYSTPVLLQ